MLFHTTEIIQIPHTWIWYVLNCGSNWKPLRVVVNTAYTVFCNVDTFLNTSMNFDEFVQYFDEFLLHF